MVKEKAQHQRLYDVDGFKKRAACVCVKNENENEVLLISSSRNNNNWIVPGGGIEDNENPEEAAAREVYEEAGVQGRLGRFLGVFESVNRKNRTSVYVFIVDKEFEDWEEHKVLGRNRKWFNLDEAKSELEKHKPVQGSYLNLLKGYDNNNKNNSYLNTHTIANNSNNNGSGNDNNNNNYNSNITTNNGNNAKDLDKILQNTDNKSSEFSNNLHFNGSTHQYSFLSTISNNSTYLTSGSPSNLLLNSTYSYNSPHASTHLDHDILSNNNTASLLNSNTT